MPKDVVLAYMWLDLAAAQNNPMSIMAGEERHSLESSLTREQVAEAQRMAREWKPTK